MDISFIALIISCVGLLSSSEAQFPFQTGPLLYDPYASFFGSNDLNPFSSNDMQIAVPTHHHKHHYYPKRPTERPQGDRPQHDNIGDHRDYHRKAFEMEPHKWSKYSRTTHTNGPNTKSNYKKLLAPVSKLNHFNKELIRPRPESEVDSIQKHISYQRNHLNSKPVINYKNSNTFRESVPPNTGFNDNHSSIRGSEKRTDSDSDDEPSTLDIDLDGDEDYEQHIHNQNHNHNPNHNHNHNHNLGENRRDRSRVQFSSPPERSTFKPHNYQIKEKAYTFDNTKHNRPALYEIEAPKNLDRNRPSTNGPTFIQNIPVPHQTLMEIADITGPPRPPTSRRPHPFEGFNQRTKPKPEAEIIVNSLDGMTRQVGASMSVQLEDRKFQPKGKIFDEPLIAPISERRQFGGSYQQKPFRPNEGNPFNSKQFDSFAINNDNNNDYRAVNNLKNNENPFPFKAQPKSDDDYDDSHEDEDVNDSPNLGFVHNVPKQSNNYRREESNRRQQKELYSDKSSQKTPLPRESREEDTPDDDSESSEEWSSNGIPGQPGKDYPMLSSVPLTSVFSCVGRPYGFYADISQKCQVYHQCSAQGSQKFLCPNGTLFSQESLVCEWWYNVVCENSEQLYHKNEQLYRNDGQRQNDDTTNDENRRTPNEYNKSWNLQNNNNNNNQNGYQNRNNDNNNKYNNHNNNHNHNNPHNHYINNNSNNNNNNFRSNSDRNRVHTRGPPERDTEYDDEVDVDLSNDESRNRFKVVSNHQLVSKINIKNKM